MPSLEQIKSDWESFAKRDAFWAILTDGNKIGGKWNSEEFLATGEAEIQTVMRHLETIGSLPDFRGATLDFGCGVGRVTQALASRFAEAVGIDISWEMTQQAELLNRYSHCRYVNGTETRLPFADASFSFVYSNIVLQHVPRRYAREYLAEFVRVLVPGGVLVFGVQDVLLVRDRASLAIWWRETVRWRRRARNLLGVHLPEMPMHCLPEREVRSALGLASIVDVQFTNTAEPDFNGRLAYLGESPVSGYVGKQYCVVR